MKIIMLCDHYPLSPRVVKVRKSIKNVLPNAEVKVVVWNRNNIKVNEDYVISINQNIGYGKKTIKLINLMKFIKKSINVIKAEKPDYIHAIDFEMLLTTYFLTRKLKKTNVIYEVFDIKFINNKLNNIRELIEGFFIKKIVTGIIYASPYFKEYYKNRIGVNNKQEIILNNKPIKEILIQKSSLKVEPALDKITIGFIGTIRHKQILENLIEATNNFKGVRLLLAGDGPFLNNIKEFTKGLGASNNVMFTGRYSYQDIGYLYSCCDYIWAAYPYKNNNVKYAVSNKYFESLVFTKKIIVSKYTCIEKIVKQERLGYTVDPYNKKEIQKLIQTLKNNLKQEEYTDIDEKNLFWEYEESRILNVYKYDF